MSKPTILAFSGSLRAESFNQSLVQVAARGAENAGAEVTVISLRDYPLPLFDEDLESAKGLPENALKLKALFERADGLLIASPEYNSSLTAALKNAVDWVSRPASKDEGALASLAGKYAGIMAASPGGLGGLRGLVHLRAILSNIAITVLPDQHAVSSAHEVIKDGTLSDERQRKKVEGIGAKLAETLAKLAD